MNHFLIIGTVLYGAVLTAATIQHGLIGGLLILALACFLICGAIKHYD